MADMGPVDAAFGGPSLGFWNMIFCALFVFLCIAMVERITALRGVLSFLFLVFRGIVLSIDM